MKDTMKYQKGFSVLAAIIVIAIVVIGAVICYMVYQNNQQGYNLTTNHVQSLTNTSVSAPVSTNPQPVVGGSQTGTYTFTTSEDTSNWTLYSKYLSAGFSFKYPSNMVTSINESANSLGVLFNNESGGIAKSRFSIGTGSVEQYLASVKNLESSAPYNEHTYKVDSTVINGVAGKVIFCTDKNNQPCDVTIVLPMLNDTVTVTFVDAEGSADQNWNLFSSIATTITVK
jgi:hypothetical protein